MPAIGHLRSEWEVNEQYQFGFVVPVLSAYMFIRRWENRPTAVLRYSASLSSVIAVLLLATFLPLSLIAGANPEWRILGWALSVVAIALTLLAVGFSGGFRWVRHFAFPVMFMLVAVPWLVQFEGRVVRALMQGNAAVAVEVLNLCGIPALRSGNIIDISGTKIGVDEACSGIRSLQTTLMAGLLFGELYYLAFVRRIGLMISALGVVLLWNLGRTLALIAIVVHRGSAAMAAWHDRVGISVLVCSMASVIGIARTFRQSDRAPSTSTVGEHGVESNPMRANLCIPRWICLAITAWIVLVFVSVEVWYREPWHEKAEGFGWTVEWPIAAIQFKDTPIPERVREQLKFTTGVNKTWRDQVGRHWSAFFFEWAPGKADKLAAYSHHPNVCLPAVGMVKSGDFGNRIVMVHGLELHFGHYRFDDHGTPLHIFFALHSTGGGSRYVLPASLGQGFTTKERLAAVISRSRDRGLRQLEVGVWGIEDEEAAVTAFRNALSGLIRRQ